MKTPNGQGVIAENARAMDMALKGKIHGEPIKGKGKSYFPQADVDTGREFQYEQLKEGARALANEARQISEETDQESETDALEGLLDDLDAGRVKLIGTLPANQEIDSTHSMADMDDQKVQALAEARIIIEGDKLLANQEERQSTIMAEQSEDEFVEKLSTDTEKFIWQNDDKAAAPETLGKINDTD